MQKNSLTILIVDDQPDDAEIVRRLLKSELDSTSNLIVAHTQEDALRLLEETRVDAIVLDYLLGKNTGLDVLREIKDEGLDIPVIVLTGHEDARVAAELIRAGADDYMVKNDLNREKMRIALYKAIESCSQRKQRREELENKLHHAERLATVGQTVAGVSHTIKGILTTLKGSDSLIETAIQNKDLKTIEGLWKVYKRSNERMDALVHSMLDYSSDMKLNKQRTNVRELLEQLAKTLDGYTKEQGVRLILRNSPDVPELMLDGEAINTALEAIAENAVQALSVEGGGTLELISRRSTNRKNVVLSVLDDGPGIPEEHLAHIFDPFYTTKGSAGTGLGLAVAHKHVIAHGGRVEVDSRPGRTVFSFRLPIQSDHVADNDQTNTSFIASGTDQKSIPAMEAQRSRTNNSRPSQARA